MRIAKVINHGQTRYRVNAVQVSGRKTPAPVFDTREAAEAFVKEGTADAARKIAHQR